jgi:hypothetical protein
MPAAQNQEMFSDFLVITEEYIYIEKAATNGLQEVVLLLGLWAWGIPVPRQKM